MKKLIIISTSLISLFFFSGCEEVIDLKLDKSKASVVIEGNITDILENQMVTVSKTVDFTNSNSKEPITLAKVMVKDNDGNTYLFPETNPGVYVSTPFKGIPGKEYTLEVLVENKTYSAKSIMPYPIKIDSLSQTELTFFGKKRKFVKVNYQDPAGVPNFYLYRLFINGKKIDGYLVESDRFNDGKQISNTVFFDKPDLVTGDLVSIDVRGITEKSYRYFFSITQITGNGGPPTTPANPDTNLTGDALGFFNACTSVKDSIVIK